MNLAEGAISYVDLTIPDGAKITETLKLEDGVYPVGFFHPAIDTSTAIVFNTKDDADAALVPVNSGGSAKSIAIDNTIAAYESLVPAEWVGIKWLQLAVADNQTGAKVISLAVRGI